MSQVTNSRSGSGGARRVVRELSNLSLEILPDKDERKVPSKSSSASKVGTSNSPSSSRPSSSRAGQRAPPVSTAAGGPRRAPTPPTKHVVLSAPRHPEPSTLTADEQRQLAEMKKFGQKSSSRKESPQSSPILRKKSLTSSSATLDSSSSSSLTGTTTASSTSGAEGGMASEVEKRRDTSRQTLTTAVDDFHSYAKKDKTKKKEKGKNTNTNGSCSSVPASATVDIDNSDQFDTDLESGEESSGEEEVVEKQRAPNQLLMEFITCVMENDWPNAHKLCRMVLMYEPDHADANKFKSLIEEKMALEEELANASSDEDEGEEDSSDEDSNSDSDDSSSEEESEEEKDEEEKTSAEEIQPTAETLSS